MLLYIGQQYHSDQTATPQAVEAEFIHLATAKVGQFKKKIH